MKRNHLTLWAGVLMSAVAALALTACGGTAEAAPLAVVPQPQSPVSTPYSPPPVYVVWQCQVTLSKRQNRGITDGMTHLPNQ